MKEELIKNLIKYDYKFIEENNIIRIDMRTWQEIIVSINDGKIIIEDRLRAWNILTTFPMKIKTALFLNPIIVVITVALIIGNDLGSNVSYFFTGILIAINVTIVTFSIYYLIRIEGMKNRIAIWLNGFSVKNK